MIRHKPLIWIGKSIIFAAVLLFTGQAISQTTDSIGQVINFRGSLSATNNGFSFIPTFSLGKPATILDLSVSGKRFSFEPQFRYSLAGRPWSFIFIWRYKLIRTDKFQLTAGTHLPALSFATVEVQKNGGTEEVIQTLRFFPVLELSPNYKVADHINVSIFYLYGRGAKEVATKNTHFLSLRANFSDIKLTRAFYLKLFPQFYYLRGDEKNGIYVATGLTLAKRDVPFSISTLLNKALRTEVAGPDFDWNISLVYSFGSTLKVGW